MNKKLMATALGVVVGGTALLGSAYAVMADSSGYDVYKSAFKQTKAVSNLTADAGVSILDNGNNVLKINSTMKADEQNHQQSGVVSIESNGQSHTVNLYNQAQKTIMKTNDSDVYKVLERNQKARDHKQNKNEQSGHDQQAEYVVDALMTNLKNDIKSQSNADGTREISLQLSEGNISPVVQSLGSVLVQSIVNDQEQQDQNESSDFKLVTKDVQASLPKITQEIKIKNIDVKAQISKDNYLEQQNATVTIVGKDVAGADHEVDLTFNLNLSHFNDTKVDSVDLTGKKVQTIQKTQRED